MPPRRIEGPLYAFRAWRLRGSRLHSFWGVVELTGRVAVHARGYRAQYARPVAVEYRPGGQPVPSATGWSCSRT